MEFVFSASALNTKPDYSCDLSCPFQNVETYSSKNKKPRVNNLYLHLSETQNIINFHFLNPIKPLPGIKNQTCFVLTIY